MKLQHQTKTEMIRMKVESRVTNGTITKMITVSMQIVFSTAISLELRLWLKSDLHPPTSIH